MGIKHYEVTGDVPPHKRVPPTKRYVNGKQVPVKQPEDLPIQPDVFKDCLTVEEVIDKMKNVIPKRHYLDLASALKVELHFKEYKIAMENDLEHNEELQFLIDQRKAKLLNIVVGSAVKDKKIGEAYKLLASSDEDRAKLNARTEVKKEQNSGMTIKIIHGTDTTQD